MMMVPGELQMLQQCNRSWSEGRTEQISYTQWWWGMENYSKWNRRHCAWCEEETDTIDKHNDDDASRPNARCFRGATPYTRSKLPNNERTVPDASSKI